MLINIFIILDTFICDWIQDLLSLLGKGSLLSYDFLV